MSEEQALSQELEELSPGAMLARARAERALGLAAVAERLKYGARQIEALEADDYARLPGATFVRGMIRGYARLLEIDPAPALRALERRNIPAQITVDLRTKRIPFPDGNRRATRLYLGLSVVALMIIAAVLYEWRSGGAAPAPVAAIAPQVVQPVAPVQEPAATGEAGPAEPPPIVAAVSPLRDDSHKRIELEFQRESWVEIKERSGRTLHSQLNAAGTRQVVEGTPPFAVVIGNAANVRLTYNDSPVDLKPYVKIEVARLTLE